MCLYTNKLKGWGRIEDYHYTYTCTVKPIMRDHCHERPPVLKDHQFLTESPTFQLYEPVTKDHLS